MKMSKRFAALLTAGLLTLTPCVTVGMTAFAGADTNYTITVDGDSTGYSYTAYQILTGEVTEKGEAPNTELVLSDIAFAPAIETNKTAFLTELAGSDILKTTKEGETTSTADFRVGMTAQEVADELAKYKNNYTKLAEFARIAKKYVSGGQTGSGSSFTVTGSGYYLFEETTAPEGKVYSRFMMDVVGNATIKPKRDLPSLNKKITGPNQNSGGTANSVSVGQNVNFEITSDMPDTTGYIKYYYVINDTLDAGLTFNSDVVVKMGTGESEKTLTAGTDYEVQTGTDAAPYTFQIVFKDFITKRTEPKDTPITVTYSALLNDKANRTAAGNVNTANLTYSNNPNEDYEGDIPTGDEPRTGDPVGETPKQKTKTYTANLQITKVDDSETPKKLAGAKFKIEGENAACVLINNEAFEVAATGGTHYMLKNGTFTTAAPNDETKANYDGYDAASNSYTMYKKVENITKTTSLTNICKEAYVNDQGVLIFNGLGPGTYTITELEAPKGYNKLTDPFTIVIKNQDPNFDAPDWSATKKLGDEEPQAITMAADSETAEFTASFNVVNHEGNTLPSTGGIGTKLFYLVGGLLAVGSGVILVTKKRMANTEK